MGTADSRRVHGANLWRAVSQVPQQAHQAGPDGSSELVHVPILHGGVSAGRLRSWGAYRYEMPSLWTQVHDRKLTPLDLSETVGQM
jgi:hypothetical protein